MEAEAAVAAARRLARLEPPVLAMPSGAWGSAEVERLIPHRPPFRFVDGVSGIDAGAGRIAGFRDVEADDPVFEGHFPGAPVFPGVLQVEAIGQLGLCLAGVARRGSVTLPANGETEDVRAVRVHHAVFPNPVAPGSRLELYAEVLEMDDFLGVVGGHARSDGRVTCSAVLEVFFA